MDARAACPLKEMSKQRKKKTNLHTHAGGYRRAKRHHDSAGTLSPAVSNVIHSIPEAIDYAKVVGKPNVGTFLDYRWLLTGITRSQ